jgi:FkbM family methyltransferase
VTLLRYIGTPKLAKQNKCRIDIKKINDHNFFGFCRCLLLLTVSLRTDHAPLICHSLSLFVVCCTTQGRQYFSVMTRIERRTRGEWKSNKADVGSISQLALGGVALGLLILSYQLVCSPTSIESGVESYLRSTQRSGVTLCPSKLDSSFLSSVAGGGAVTCREVQERVDRGEWHDPNEGKIFARRIVTEPHFLVSVHNDTYDMVRWQNIFVKGKYYEDLVHSRFLEILSAKPRSLVLDVGANIGYYTLLSAALGHVVISFEINPANIVRICESLHLNQWKDSEQVAIFQRGASNVDGVTLQVLIPKNPGQAFMKEMEGVLPDQSNATSTHHAYTTTVTLDSFAQERRWFDTPGFSISLLKLDVEGKEPQIIEGAKRLLKSGIVQNILTEFRRLGRPTIQKAIATLLDSGYTLVHNEKGKVSRAEARRLLDELRHRLEGKMLNLDLWFQRE